MKKKILLVVVLILLLVSGCGKEEGKGEGEFKIGVLQYIEHDALDYNRSGFLSYLNELGISYDYDLQNAQGDISNARTMAEKFVSDGVDLIFAIGTPAAEAAKSVTDEIPILFSSVTDPVESNLIESMEEPGGNVTGTSDASNIYDQLKLFKDLGGNIKDIGIIYSLNETNSLSQLEESKKEAGKLDLNIIEKGIENISDLPQTANSLVSEIDGMFILSDNKIASSISLLSDILIKNNKPSISVEESQVRGGGLMTVGLSYFELGQQTGEMAKKILVEKLEPSSIPSEYAKKLRKYVNENTMEELGFSKDLKVFEGAEFVGNQEEL